MGGLFCMENKLYYIAAADYFEEALPLGNGSLGAMVYGKTAKEKISLNHDTLWSGKPRRYTLPHAYEAYLEAQKMILNGDRVAANDLLEHEFTGPYGQSYLPLGNLYIERKNAAQPTAYARTLNMENGTAVVEYEESGIRFKRTYFVSYPDNCLAVHVTSGQPCDYVISMDSQVKYTIEAENNALYLRGECPSLMPPGYAKDAVPVEYDGDGIHFTAIGSVVGNGTIVADGNEITVTQSTDFTVLLCAETSFIDFDTLPKKDCEAPCRARIRALCKKTYEALYSAHTADFASYYNRVKLDLGFAPSALSTKERMQAEDKSNDLGLVELLFNFGRYLVIASSREGSQATNLQGIWNEHLYAPWSSNYTVNINTEMNYWPVLMCNLAGMDLPVVDLVKKISVTGADCAKAYFNGKGYCCHHNIDLWGLATPVGAQRKGSLCWGYWCMAAGWLCRHLWAHYEYTLDRSFLAETAYPLMKGAAEFYLSVMIEDNGKYIISPSTSPENMYVFGEHNLAVAKYTTMSQAIVMDLFQNISNAAEVLGIRDEFVNEVREKLPLVNTYAIGSEGQLLEYDADFPEWDIRHRHTSHLYGLYPGESITTESTPALAEACRKTLYRRGDQSTGWSMGWRVNLWAKLKDGNHALQLVKNQLRYVPCDSSLDYRYGGGTYANLFDAHPPFQIDGNFGVCAGIAQMFLQCEDGKIRILPALPDDFQNGSVSGLKAKGNVTVNIAWQNGVLTQCTLEAETEQTVTVALPNGERTVYLPAGESVTVQ